MSYFLFLFFFFFFFKQKTAYEMLRSLVGSEMCIRDSCGPSGLTTEAFVDEITQRINQHVQAAEAGEVVTKAAKSLQRNFTVDTEAIQQLFQEYDKDQNGAIDMQEFTELLVDLDIAPKEKITEKASKDTEAVASS
eukprot:TRINITY_DN13334_c0_g1_i5.p1 TRINITY_DN13334_c0_g1~~TRINITY_DN13334_c0_g1_i5.p1  ORF type:complete len:136 (+),score=73.94 TRINITY_DN13334_c0_g1_i5:32-439(+)